jgi:hypothetical protein
VRAGVEGAEPFERVEVVAGGAQHPERQAGAARRDWWEDSVQSYPLAGRGQPAVDERLRVVETAAAGEGEPLSEATHRVLVGEGDLGAPQPVLAVDPDLIRGGDEDICGGAGTQKGFEWAGADELLTHEPHGVEHVGVTDDPAGLLPDGPRHDGGGDVVATAREAAAHSLDEVGLQCRAHAAFLLFRAWRVGPFPVATTSSGRASCPGVAGGVGSVSGLAERCAS